MDPDSVVTMRGGTPFRVDKPSGKSVVMVAKRWHVLEVLALAGGWTRIVELGVFRGWTTLHLLKHLPAAEIVGVDLYRQPEGKGAERYDGDLEAVYEQMTRALARFGDRARLMRMDTVAAAGRFEDRSVDAVFIDADHRRDAVIADIGAWRSKVRLGGWLLGHDWHWDGVKEAVTECVGEPALFPDNVWGVRQ